MKRSRLVVKSPVTGTPDFVEGIEVSAVGLGEADGLGVGLMVGVGLAPPSAFAEAAGDGEGELDGFAVVLAEPDDVNSRPDEPFGFVDGEGLGELFSICRSDFGDVRSPGVPAPVVFRKS